MKFFSWVLVIVGFGGLAAAMSLGLESVGQEYDRIAQYASASANDVVAMYTDREQEPEQYTVALVGDMMIDRGVKAQVYEHGGGDYKFLFQDLHHILQSADVTFGNLEGSLSNVGADTGKKYSFRFEPQAADALAWAGFDVVSLANNHIFDWGKESLCATITNLDSVGIFGSGAGCNMARAEQPFVREFDDGTTMGLLSFTEFYKGGYATENRAGLARYSNENMVNRIQMLEEEGIDIIFVSLHWGLEYHTRSNESQQNLARDLIDAGADVVVGHHPHVAQEIERYSNGWIIYSLGNFIFDQNFSEQTMKGLLANVVIQEGAVVDIEPVIVQLNQDYQPSIDLEGGYEYLAGAELEAAHRAYHEQGAPR